MSKFGTHADYPRESLGLAEAGLLTAWRSLERYHQELVLVGGLAVHYLTRRQNPGSLPGAVTMDVDFGVSLVASGGQYGTIKSDLAGLGFKSARLALQEDFSAPDSDGPIRAAEFCISDGEERERVRELTATVGRMLLGI